MYFYIPAKLSINKIFNEMTHRFKRSPRISARSSLNVSYRSESSNIFEYPFLNNGKVQKNVNFENIDAFSHGFGNNFG